MKTAVSSRRFMYKLLRNMLFLFPAESIHHFSMKGLKIICWIPGCKFLIRKLCCPQSEYKQNTLDLDCRNPVGLGAGFDKNARYLNELEILGFGFVEIG